MILYTSPHNSLPISWEGPQMTLDQPNHKKQPGLAQYAIWAGYQDADGEWLLLLSDGMGDPAMQILDLAYADPTKKEILWGACLHRAQSKWNVPYGSPWSIREHSWVRQPP